MKILLINKFHYKRGGSETYYFAQAEALTASGHEVVFFAMQDPKNLPCEQSKYFVSNVEYNDHKQNFLSQISSLIKIIYSYEAKERMEQLIRDEKPDIAHIGLLHRQITFSVVDILKKYNIPVIMTMHDLIFTCPCYTMLSHGKICKDCLHGSIWNCVKKSCLKDSKAKSLIGVIETLFLKYRKYYDKIDLYIAECNKYKDLMVESGFTRSRIIQMTNFLPINQEYKFNSNYDDYILYFGRYSQEKGILTLLAAYQKMHCKNRLVIVGAGPLRDKIESYIRENHVENVELNGAIYGEKMEEIIEKSRVIVAPSEWYENCPYAIMQSMAKGKIVVASKIGGLPQLIENGVSGFLFEPGNVEDLAKKLNYVLSLEKDEYERISHRILDSAKRQFYWKTYFERLLTEYSSLIGRHKSFKN